MRKTGIQCTIGPSCGDAWTIAQMINAGARVFRFNLSHSTAEDAEDRYQAVLDARTMTGAEDVKIMFDLRGPEVRLLELPGGELEWKTGETIVLPEITYKNLINELEIGTLMLIDDGKVRLEVREIKDNDILCEVLQGGIVKSHKGINVPDIKMQMEYLRQDDMEDILWCINHEVDYIAGSFIRREDDVRVLRKFIDDNGGHRLKIIAKLENKEAIDNLEAIANIADSILVARGDLGVEVGFENVPALQKRLCRRCAALGKRLIVATQLLESMTNSPVPTRAEVSDIANAVYDGATDLLVTGETAAGKYPVEVIKELVKVVDTAEHDIARYGSDIL